jgi:hypothetical protein
LRNILTKAARAFAESPQVRTEKTFRPGVDLDDYQEQLPFA